MEGKRRRGAPVAVAEALCLACFRRGVGGEDGNGEGTVVWAGVAWSRGW